MLDEDHYDLEKVKDRIIEHLAVSKLRNDPSGQILCFVGPPGVGKTSLGHSIARTLERKFARLSVGGVRDEAEIRGHRRTYIGAMPGSIIRALRDAESMNPVLLIDEIDKMGADVRGDPASAMLEVLDPEQNRTFRDHYLDLPFDLSKVLFICTANTTDTIPGPLLDRMDVISLSGYTEDEKLGIARRYLVPKQIEAHGLQPDQLTVSDDALRLVIREYTREAGVRGLERRIADLCRKAARKVAEGREGAIDVDERRVRESLGPRRFSGDPRRRTADPGVATGLAYTAAGGDVLFIEATAYRRQGQADDHRPARRGDAGVCAGGALVGARARRRSSACPTTGSPSTTCTSTSRRARCRRTARRRESRWRPRSRRSCAGSPVADDVGMTGEITLTGQVLGIGGVREKVLAAQRAGLKRVILPSENEPDLEDLPGETRAELAFVLVDSVEQVFEVAFSPNGNGLREREAREEQVARRSSGARADELILHLVVEDEADPHRPPVRLDACRRGSSGRRPRPSAAP